MKSCNIDATVYVSFESDFLSMQAEALRLHASLGKGRANIFACSPTI